MTISSEGVVKCSTEEVGENARVVLIGGQEFAQDGNFTGCPKSHPIQLEDVENNVIKCGRTCGERKVLEGLRCVDIEPETDPVCKFMFRNQFWSLGTQGRLCTVTRSVK